MLPGPEDPVEFATLMVAPVEEAKAVEPVASKLRFDGTRSLPITRLARQNLENKMKCQAAAFSANSSRSSVNSNPAM